MGKAHIYISMINGLTWKGKVYNKGSRLVVSNKDLRTRTFKRLLKDLEKVQGKPHAQGKQERTFFSSPIRII